MSLEYFRQQGAKGGKTGARKSWAKMTPAERSARAKKASLAGVEAGAGMPPPDEESGDRRPATSSEAGVVMSRTRYMTSPARLRGSGTGSTAKIAADPPRCHHEWIESARLADLACEYMLSNGVLWSCRHANH